MIVDFYFSQKKIREMSRLFKFLSGAISRPVLECPASFVFLTVL